MCDTGLISTRHFGLSTEETVRFPDSSLAVMAQIMSFAQDSCEQDP